MNVDGVRQKVATRFAETLENESLGKQLEIVLWNHTLRYCDAKNIPLEWSSSVAYDSFRELYTQRAISLDIYNLKKNDILREKLRNGELKLKKFIDMKPWEMNPEMWAPIFERVAFKALRKQTTRDVESAPDGAFQCSACKSKKTTYYQLQTRASDEPMTTFIQCLNCQRRWKQ
jgi:DNA-directed RNA polymerase subunit M/transcription elongation factor TFIIS